MIAALAAVAARTAQPDEEAGETADRVGFPADYPTRYEIVRVANKTKVEKLGTIYANEKAASIHEASQLPYPAGSIIVMEWAQPLRDESGAPLTGADGLWRKGEVVRVDVMRREPGYGERYGDSRSGEWEFATYNPDGSYQEPPEKSVSCAACHQQPGIDRDFVFRGRFPELEAE